MKSILKKWTESSLILKIVAGLVIGAVLGLLFPKASFFGITGTLFIGALKAIAPILVFLLVSSAIAQAVNGIDPGSGRSLSFIFFPRSWPRSAQWQSADCSR